MLKAINFVVPTETERELRDNGFALHFAVRYFKGVVLEFGVDMEFHRNLDLPASLPIRTYSHERFGERFAL